MPSRTRLDLSFALFWLFCDKSSFLFFAAKVLILFELQNKIPPSTKCCLFFGRGSIAFHRRPIIPSPRRGSDVAHSPVGTADNRQVVEHVGCPACWTGNIAEPLPKKNTKGDPKAAVVSCGFRIANAHIHGFRIANSEERENGEITQQCGRGVRSFHSCGGCASCC